MIRQPRANQESIGYRYLLCFHQARSVLSRRLQNCCHLDELGRRVQAVERADLLSVAAKKGAANSAASDTTFTKHLTEKKT
jgi:hypothetical protein